jgi:hypothetical protein
VPTALLQELPIIGTIVKELDDRGKAALALCVLLDLDHHCRPLLGK